MHARYRYLIAFAVCTLGAGGVQSQVVAPSFYTTTIQVQGEAEGTEFDDWADVPIAYTDPEDNPGDIEGVPFIDVASIQVANDNNFLYIHASFHNESSAGTLIGIDLDQDKATGWDIFEVGVIGSDVGYINDFPFQQNAASFNLNLALTGGPLTNGGALLFPFWDQDGFDKEWAIPLDLALGFPAGDPAFTQATIDLQVYTDEGAGDIVDETITYTLVFAPELQGDYNGDDVVDAADYTVWRDSLNDIGEDLPADGNGDMQITEADYEVWRDNYGAGAAGASASSSIPEPTTGALLLLAVLGRAQRRRRR